ncbi:hypothetical protein ACMD2_10126 [Ananas comosus]|uniref:Uncharacterized protein n=1 Tax=Ananas comosus TaxID=4615 RepID=A0A199V9T4_ANACO|nr:hypothetical protein ACMD2_10126 [Ananas comosus]
MGWCALRSSSADNYTRNIVQWLFAWSQACTYRPYPQCRIIQVIQIDGDLKWLRSGTGDSSYHKYPSAKKCLKRRRREWVKPVALHLDLLTDNPQLNINQKKSNFTQRQMWDGSKTASESYWAKERRVLHYMEIQNGKSQKPSRVDPGKEPSLSELSRQQESAMG